MQNIDRRSVVYLGLGAALNAVAGCATTGGEGSVPGSSTATDASTAPNVIEQTRSITIHHKGDTFSGVYKVGEDFQAAALEQLDYVLRDKRATGGIREIDPKLFDLLFDLSNELGVSPTFNVISGYRSVETNRVLRQIGIDARGESGVSLTSYHTTGQAIDFNMPGVSLESVRDAAINLRRGGVGYYPDPESNFVHVDTGPVRTW